MYGTALVLTVLGAVIVVVGGAAIAVVVTFVLAGTALAFGLTFSYRAWWRRRRGAELGRSPASPGDV